MSLSTSCWAAISSDDAVVLVDVCWVIGEWLCASFTLRWVYIGLLLAVARFLITTFGRARDAAIVRWMSGIAVYSVHRSCDRLALRLAIVSLWGESYAIE